MSSELFTIKPFSPTNLFDSLQNEYCSAAEVEQKDSALYLHGYLAAIGTRTLLIEPRYVDGDYLDDYADYYVKCFRPFRRFCSRIHFFSADLTDDFFTSAVNGQSPGNVSVLESSYLGFVVARPLPEAIIGRTVLKTYSDDGGRRNYTCLLPYEVNLFGLTLRVQSLAFQEQDTVLAACATVSLWTALHKTSHLFGTPKLTPVSITRAATAMVGSSRPTPSHGLAVYQLCNAIRHVGLEPEIVNVVPGTPIASLLYAYLRAGIPAILGIKIDSEFHAITVDGFSLRKSQALVNEGELSGLRMVGRRIDEFYAHDDGFGPFSRLQVLAPMVQSFERQKLTFNGSWKDSTGNPIELIPDVVVIPVYGKIRLTFTDIQKWILRLDSIVDVLPGTDSGQEWEIYLGTSNEVKRELRRDSDFVGSPRLEQFLFDNQPRFLWRSVLRINGIKILELLADATGIARSFPFYDVIWYFDPMRKFLNAMLAIGSLQAGLNQRLTSRFLQLLKDRSKLN